MSPTLFPDRIEENPEGVSQADLVVGIASHGEPHHNMSASTEVAARGLEECFPGKRGVVVNCDEGSTDGAREAFLGIPTAVPKIYLSTPAGIKGKGNGILNLLDRAQELQAEAVVVVDAGAENIKPVWIRNLMEPLLDEYDLVAPLYMRNRYEAGLSNHVVYPLNRCLFGKRVHEPAGGDFGVSSRLAGAILQEQPESCMTGFGIHTWITTLAIAQGLPVCQSFLGAPRAYRDDDLNMSSPGTGFTDNVETVFRLMDRYHDVWRRVRWSKPLVTLGLEAGVSVVANETKPDLQGMFDSFQQGFKRYKKVWNRVLHLDVQKKLNEVRTFPLDTFEFPALMWVLILFDFALAHKQETLETGDLMNALFPLYLGRVCSGALSTAHMDPKQVEVYIDDQCRVFEETKPYLDYLWEKR